MLAQRRAGMSLAAIAEQHHISRERVRQIVSRLAGESSTRLAERRTAARRHIDTTDTGTATPSHPSTG